MYRTAAAARIENGTSDIAEMDFLGEDLQQGQREPSHHATANQSNIVSRPSRMGRSGRVAMNLPATIEAMDLIVAAAEHKKQNGRRQHAKEMSYDRPISQSKQENRAIRRDWQSCSQQTQFAANMTAKSRGITRFSCWIEILDFE